MEFTPFVKTQAVQSHNDLVTAVRRDIIGELDAINQYNAHIATTDNELAKRVWTDIRNEERVHVGELLTLLEHLSPDEASKLKEGRAEVQEIMREMGIQY